MYDGRTPLEEGTVVGHEIMGVIESVGEAVQSIKKGDRVVLPFNIACGFCFNCHRGHTEACLTMNPEAPHAAYGYAGMGPYQGGQAEFVLVPYADFNCLKVPGKPGDEWEDDFRRCPTFFQRRITRPNWRASLPVRQSPYLERVRLDFDRVLLSPEGRA